MNETRDWRWSPRKDHIELYVVATDTVIDMGQPSVSGMVQLTHMLNAMEGDIRVARDEVATQAARIEALTKALEVISEMARTGSPGLAKVVYQTALAALRQDQPASEGEA